MSRQKKNEEAPEDFGEFTVWFMKVNSALINKHIRKRLIPNRYSVEDMKSYMQERILDILQKRLAKGRPIEEPKLYFKRLIDYWCVEYQRMHGFCYGLPKRPRKPEAEEEISQYGFVYFPHKGDSEDGNTYSMEHIPQLGYIDSNISDPNNYEYNPFRVINEDPDEFSETWDGLMNQLLPEDKDVVTYIYRYNLTVPQVSEQLGIAISTAYNRKDRALRVLSGFIENFSGSLLTR